MVASKDGQPRFCAHDHSTVNRHIMRKSWPMANLGSNIDTVGKGRLINVFNVTSAYWLLPVHPTAAFFAVIVCRLVSVMPLGILLKWLIKHLAILYPKSLAYIDDLRVLSPTRENL